MHVLPREERDREEIEGDGGTPSGDCRHLPAAAKQRTSSCTSPSCQSSHTPLSHRSGSSKLATVKSKFDIYNTHDVKGPKCFTSQHINHLLHFSLYQCFNPSVTAFVPI
ncbi:hypothetical protein CsSME_00012864 [Camellia sinensis var. sinensis]